MGAADRDAAIDALLATSRTMTAIVARTLGPLERVVTVPQLRVLVMISVRGPLNLTAVAEGLAVNASSASRTCEKLVVGGLLTRSEQAEDRRNIALGLTEQGVEVVTSLMEARRALFDSVVAQMGAVEQRRLALALEDFHRALGATLPGEEILGSGDRWMEWLIWDPASRSAPPLTPLGGE